MNEPILLRNRGDVLSRFREKHKVFGFYLLSGECEFDKRIQPCLGPVLKQSPIAPQVAVI